MTPAPAARRAGDARVHRPVFVAVRDALRRIMGQGSHAERVVDETLRHQLKWGARDRRQFAEMVYDLVRRWRWYAWVAEVHDAAAFSSDLSDSGIERLWSAYWIDRGNSLPPFIEGDRAACDGMAARLTATPPLAVKASIPDWLNDVGTAAYGEQWPSILAALNEPADVFLRANTLRVSREALALQLHETGIATEVVRDLPDALRLVERRSLATHPAVRQGHCEFQDAGSQSIAPFLTPEPGQIVIDACAGAGGKSLHLACLMKNAGRVVAMDIHPARLAELARRATRAGATLIRTQLVASPDDLAPFAGTADRVLLDVPCSGLGVLRRHPDTKWKLKPSDLDRLGALQSHILDTYTAAAKPGGLVVYATCSVLPRENEDQVRAFLARQPDRWTLDAEQHLLPTAGNHDGYYIARLRRRS